MGMLLPNTKGSFVVNNSHKALLLTSPSGNAASNKDSWSTSLASLDIRACHGGGRPFCQTVQPERIVREGITTRQNSTCTESLYQPRSGSEIVQRDSTLEEGKEK
jgi:hypothetical protein